MVDRLAAASGHELEVLLDTLFENAAKTPTKIPGVSVAYDPILGRLFIANEDHAELRLSICRALVAGAKFRQEVPPDWPAALPMRREDIAAMIDDDDPRRRVTGMFGDSLRWENWAAEHPSFNPFVRGLMACRSTPIAIRSDAALLERFPPCRLKGMTGGWLTWRSAETLAVDRRNRRMVAALEARASASV